MRLKVGRPFTNWTIPMNSRGSEGSAAQRVLDKKVLEINKSSRVFMASPCIELWRKYNYFKLTNFCLTKAINQELL